MQKGRNSSALLMALHLFCIKRPAFAVHFMHSNRSRFWLEIVSELSWTIICLKDHIIAIETSKMSHPNNLRDYVKQSVNGMEK